MRANRLNIKRVLPLWLITSTAFFLPPAPHAQPLTCSTAQKPMQVAELLFGRKIGDRIGVSEAAWARFLAREVTPRFPDGLTVINASGQWRDRERNKVVREPSKVVQIVLPGAADDEEKLAAVIEAYKREFRQQGVGLIIRPACVRF